MKVPKIKSKSKKKVPGYVDGGTTFGFADLAPVVQKPVEEKRGKRLRDLKFGEALKDVGLAGLQTVATTTGAGALLQGVTGKSINELIGQDYNSQLGQTFGKVNSKIADVEAKILPTAAGVGATALTGSPQIGALVGAGTAGVQNLTDANAASDIQKGEITDDLGGGGYFKRGGKVSYSAKKAVAGKDIGKPGKNFDKIADKAAVKYGSEEAGKKVAGAILAHLRGKADGGKIEGTGTAKSDSIKAEIKPGSFIVPAENAKLAEAIRDKYLKSSGKAKLNQGGGVPVKLSNGEHMFTPEETKKLVESGVDINKLAPNAKKENKYAEGGIVRAKRLLAQAESDKQQINKLASDYDKRIASQIKEAERANDIKKKAALQKEAAAEKSKFEKRLSDLDSNLTVLSSAYEKSNATAKNTTGGSKFSTGMAKNDARYYEERLTAAADDYEKAKGEYDKKYPSTGGRGALTNPDAVLKSNTLPIVDESGKPLNKQAAGTSSAVKSTATSNKPVAQAANNNTSGENVDFITPKGGYKLGSAPAETDTNAIASELKGVNSTPIVPSGKTDNVFSNVNVADLIGVAQAGIGLQQLNGLGRSPIGTQPVDKIPQDLIDSVNQSKINATEGYTPAVASSIINNLESARVGSNNFATGISGQDPTKAGQYQRAATREYTKGLLGMEAEGEQLKLQKQAYRDSLINRKAAYSRQLFEDKMRVFDQNLDYFNQKQQAFGGLANTGFQNLIDSSQSKQSNNALVDALKQSNYTF